MALIERCLNAWHMLIERLILSNFFFDLIKSGVQVSIYLSWPKVRERSLINLKRWKLAALGGSKDIVEISSCLGYY